MANILFMYNNLADAGSVTGSSAATGFVANNVLQSFRTKVWTTEGVVAGTANLVIDLGSAQAVTCIALADYNWASAPGTLDLEFNNADAWGAPAVTEVLTWAANPTANGNPGIIVKTFASQTYRYLRLNVVYAPGDWSLGRIFIGTYFEPTYNYDYYMGQRMDIVDPSFVSETMDGQEHVDTITKFRVIQFMCKAMTQTEWEAFQLMLTTVGTGKDLFIAFDYDNEPDEMTWYGKFVRIPRMRKRIIFDLPFMFKESR